jgi:hypothetical protein
MDFGGILIFVGQIAAISSIQQQTQAIDLIAMASNTFYYGETERTSND